jgi:dTDP-4-dehydrorhamnose reductase
LQKKGSLHYGRNRYQKKPSLEEEISWYDKAWATVKNLGNAQLAAADITASRRKQKALEDLQSSLDLTNAEMTAFLKKTHL